MMKLEERPTPLTDAESRRLENTPRLVGWDAFEDMADFARRLERVAAELAEALIGTGYGDTDCLCDDCACKAAREALAKYEASKKEVLG